MKNKTYKLGRLFGVEIILKSPWLNDTVIQGIKEQFGENVFIYFYDGDENGHLPKFVKKDEPKKS
jgi:hypothetical protein